MAKIVTDGNLDYYMYMYVCIFLGPTPSVRVPHSQTVDRPLSRSNMASGLDVFDKEGLSPIGGQDFGSKIRDKVLGEHNKKDSLTEFEVRGQQRPILAVLARNRVHNSNV